MIFITNFNNTREFSDIKQAYENDNGTNIDFILEDFPTGNTTWSVPKKALPGDYIIFMCAKMARNNLGMALSDIPKDSDPDFIRFLERQKDLYKRYSGKLLGYGIVESVPEKGDTWWIADIGHLVQFTNPVPIEDFRSFIFISRTNAITYLNDDQWARLKWTIHQKNPEIFTDALPPEQSILEKEFNDAVRKASEKPIEDLRKIAEKKQSKNSLSMTQVKVYHRDPAIAAYVKKRANGYCQSCGSPAPFVDPNCEPYLECHHIEWLSRGGTDSIDNCVALCPNCHRKMHILNLENDIALLKQCVNHS